MDDRRKKFTRIALAAIATIGLAVIYIIQYTDFLYVFTGTRFQPEAHFIVNRSVRILVNDTCMLLIIYALFNNRKVIKLALIIQAVDLFILFPIYLAFKLPAEGVSELSSPFLSQFHRLIVNPTLMILLILGFFYQRIRNPENF